MSSKLATGDVSVQTNQAAIANFREKYRRTRRFSERIAEPLSAEDCAMQTMPDVSPTRWHLAHTTWFFETFLLKDSPSYQSYDSSFEYLFNSYYNAVGEQFPRNRRGQLSRPGLAETMEYRRHVDQHVLALLEGDEVRPDMLRVVELGLNHEQQHQELMLTDIKHVLFCNPLYPVYQESHSSPGEADVRCTPLTWETMPEGISEIGHAGDGFAFDNESPRHKTFLQAHSIASRCVTNGEYLEFMRDGGYQRPDLWLSLGWNQVQLQTWQHPLYWISRDDVWMEFTLAGLRELRLDEPLCHVSYFEADAYARWSGNRLPTELEWEALAAGQAVDGVFADKLLENDLPVHPQTENKRDERVSGMFGNLWEWTASQYSPYPGFAAAGGALGEYNGKFMCNQFVLRGGSCATSSDHIRPTYRNFFPPESRWQFSGIRLAN